MEVVWKWVFSSGLRFTALNYFHSIEPRKIPSSESLITTEYSIAFDNKLFLSETLVKLIRDDNELKTSHRRH